MQILESCHSTWTFDPERMRYRRILREVIPGSRPVSTQWRPYFGLEIDADGESFTVVLNQEGTRLLRSRRHTAYCAQCEGNLTGEVSLADVNGALGR